MGTPPRGLNAGAGVGLVYLKGLTNLQLLILTSTKVTDAGVANLQKALPNCKIAK